LAHQREPAFDKRPVFAGERRHVHNGANGDQVEPLIEVDRRVWTAQQAGFSQLVCQPHPREFLVGVRVSRLVGVDDCVRWGKLTAGLVMVGDDDAHAQLFCAPHLPHGADAAVNGNEQPGSFGCQRFNRLQIEPVAFLKTVRDVDPRLMTKQLEKLK